MCDSRLLVRSPDQPRIKIPHRQLLGQPNIKITGFLRKGKLSCPWTDTVKTRSSPENPQRFRLPDAHPDPAQARLDCTLCKAISAQTAKSLNIHSQHPLPGRHDGYLQPYCRQWAPLFATDPTPQLPPYQTQGATNNC